MWGTMTSRNARTLLIAGAASLLLGLLAIAAWIVAAPSGGKLNYRLDLKPTVMTVAYKAYGNKEAADGKYWLGKLRLTNDGDAPLDDLQISYRIPGHLDTWTTPEAAEQLLPGQTAGVVFYPRLPRSVTTIRTRTPASLEVKLAWNDDGEPKEQIERRDFEFRGVTEIEYTSLPADEVLGWYDMFDNAELTAAFVTHEDEVVRQYLGKISETKGGLPITSDAKELAKVMRSIYDFMADTGMTYAGNAGVPEQLGDTTSMVQSVRLPRDVVYQNSGLCIELAMLWAALGKGAGADAYLILVPGHCYPVLKAADGTMIAIESTGVGGSNLGGTMTFEQAVEAGNKQLGELMAGKLPGRLVDVTAEQGRGIRPPEFQQADLAGLSDMLAQRVKDSRSGATNTPDATTSTDATLSVNPTGLPAPQPTVSNWPSTMVAGLTVRYPLDYQPNGLIVQQVKPYLPSYAFNAVDGTGMRSIEAYDFGPVNQQQAIGQLADFASQMGAGIQFGGSQETQFTGKPANLVMVQMAANGMILEGGMYFVPTNGRLIGVAVMSPQGDTSWQQVATTIAAGQ